MNVHTIPTPDEIDAVVFDMIAAEVAQVPDDTSLDDLWSSVALDRHGEFRGYGFGHTPAEARAGAWITAWWPECDWRAVPSAVPEGWTFEIYSPGRGPVFRRTSTVTTTWDKSRGWPGVTLTDLVRNPPAQTWVCAAVETDD